jgi:hypothetical protein
MTRNDNEYLEAFPRELDDWRMNGQKGMLWRQIAQSREDDAARNSYYYLFKDGFPVGYVRELRGVWFASDPVQGMDLHVPFAVDEAVRLVESYEISTED